MSSQNGYRGVYLKRIFCVKEGCLNEKLVAALAVIVILTGCVYDPVNYDKIRPRVPRPPQAKRLVIKTTQ